LVQSAFECSGVAHVAGLEQELLFTLLELVFAQTADFNYLFALLATLEHFAVALEVLVQAALQVALAAELAHVFDLTLAEVFVFDLVFAPITPVGVFGGTLALGGTLTLVTLVFALVLVLHPVLVAQFVDFLLLLALLQKLALGFGFLSLDFLLLHVICLFLQVFVGWYIHNASAALLLQLFVEQFQKVAVAPDDFLLVLVEVLLVVQGGSWVVHAHAVR